ncbi:MAG: hypothetical protein ABL940_13415, partial [Bacteroidia bacterium]
MNRLAYFILFLSFCFLQKSTLAQLPTNIAGLNAWFAADSCVLNGNGTIAQLNDLSGNGYNATPASLSESPTLSTNVAELNNKKVILFDGNDFLTTNAPRSSSFTLYIICKRNSIVSEQHIMEPNVIGYEYFYRSTVESIHVFGVNTAIGNTTQYNIFSLKDSVSSLRVYKNDSLLFTNTTSIPTGNGWVIGAYAGGNYNLKGAIAEILLYNHSLTKNENDSVIYYLRNKYVPKLNLGANIVVPTGFCDTTLSVANYYTNYKWSNGINDTAQIKVNKTGTYILRAKDAFGFDVSDTIQVTYAAIPTSLPAIKTICPSSIFNYTTNLTHANYSFQWSNGSSDSLLNITNAGNYAVQITDNNGCIYTSDTTQFVIDAFPSYATLGVDTALCVGNTIQLKKGAAQAVSYLWNTTDTTPSITISTGGQYTLQANNSNGCVVNDTINITLLGTAPIANFTYNNNCKGNSINCINTSAPPSGASITTNNWFINYGGITGNGVDFNPVVNDTLTYLVTLNISSSNGCSNSVQKNIKVYNQPKVSITALNSCTNDSTQLKALPLLQGNVFDYYTWTTP